MTQQHAFAGKTAIVIGASMGGLLAARRWLIILSR